MLLRDVFLCAASFLFLFPISCKAEVVAVLEELRHRQRRGIRMTPAQKQSMVDRHNYHRSKELTAANMAKMRWNEYLAQMASEWADRCVRNHGNPSRPPDTMPFKYIGQNMAASFGGPQDLEGCVDRFYLERDNYDYNSNGCKPGKKCGHYTQLVWAESTDVGCGVTQCNPLKGANHDGPAWLYVCNYGPAGNWPGQKPFIAGRQCSKCAPGKSCSNGLCNV